MRKSDIERLAKAKSAGGNRIAPDARRAAKAPAKVAAVITTPESIKAIGDAVARNVIESLAVLLPVCARLAAADTLHTAQKPETVMRDAIAEGMTATMLIREIVHGSDNQGAR